MNPPSVDEIPSLSFDELSEHKRLSRVNLKLYLSIVEHIDRELLARSPTANYKCMKCGNSKYEEHRV